MQAMNLPNILTLIRVLLTPVFVIFIINKYFQWALLTFAIAGITDGLDGLIARLTQQRTELGAYRPHRRQTSDLRRFHFPRHH